MMRRYVRPLTERAGMVMETAIQGLSAAPTLSVHQKEITDPSQILSKESWCDFDVWEPDLWEEKDEER